MWLTFCWSSEAAIWAWGGECCDIDWTSRAANAVSLSWVPEDLGDGALLPIVSLCCAIKSPNWTMIPDCYCRICCWLLFLPFPSCQDLLIRGGGWTTVWFLTCIHAYASCVSITRCSSEVQQRQQHPSSSHAKTMMRQQRPRGRAIFFSCSELHSLLCHHQAALPLSVDDNNAASFTSWRKRGRETGLGKNPEERKRVIVRIENGERELTDGQWGLVAETDREQEEKNDGENIPREINS